MSAYDDFVHDFPTRCKDLLTAAARDAAAMEREVTLSIMTAAAGFLVPFERLNPNVKHEHPALDRQRHPEIAGKLDDLLNERFLNSCLWNSTPSTWKAGKLKSIDNAPDDWPELQAPRTLSADRLVKSVVGVLRNALAHGNIYTLGRPQIRDIVFISRLEDQDGNLLSYRFVQVSPVDFRGFLVRWFDFLSSSCISQASAATAIESAAEQLVSELE
jgi:hypothetical protein